MSLEVVQPDGDFFHKTGRGVIDGELVPLNSTGEFNNPERPLLEPVCPCDAAA